LFVRLYFRLVVGLMLFGRCFVLGDDSEIRLEYFTEIPSFLEYEQKPSTFIRRFESALSEQSAEVFADRLHSFNLLNWRMDENFGHTSRIADAANQAARSALERTVTYSLREAALGFPLIGLLDENPTIAFELLRGTVDEVNEESVSPIDPSFGLAERSWWKRLSSGGHLRYGLRPFRTNPYAFLSFRLNRDERTYLLGHVRYYFRHWAEQRLDLAMSLPLVGGFAIDAGTSFTFGNESTHNAVVKLFKNLGSAGVMHVGVEIKDHPTLLAGVAFPW
jgi:hypothetical protein